MKIGCTKLIIKFKNRVSGVTARYAQLPLEEATTGSNIIVKIISSNEWFMFVAHLMYKSEK